MERFLTVLAASLCAAPLFFILTIRWILPLIKGLLPIGSGMGFTMSLSVSIGIGLIGFVLVGGLAWFFSGRGYFRPVQMATGLLLAGWSLAWVMFTWNEPRSLDYHGQRAVLEAEVRVDKSLLNGQPLQEAVALSYTGGDFDVFHLDGVREEGNFVILPWEITVHTVYKWALWATIAQHKSYFPLNLPYRPTQSTDWSDWVTPVPHKGSTTFVRVTLRYRLLVLPLKS